MKFLWTLLLVLSFNSSIATMKDFTYKAIDGSNKEIQVHSPKKAKNAPCIILFHGGGWAKGDLSQFTKVCEYFASRGMVAITANYSKHDKKNLSKLSKGESRKRICVMDAKSVMRWTISNAKKLGINTDKIVVGGASAGGHISLLSLLDDKYNNPQDPKVNIDAKAVLLFCPAFTTLSRDRTPDVNIFNNLKAKLPPLVFFTGETDNWEKASGELHKALKSKKAEVTYWMAKSEGHMFHRKPDWYEICLIEADKYLVAEGILSGKSTLSYKGQKALVKIK